MRRSSDHVCAVARTLDSSAVIRNIKLTVYFAQPAHHPRYPEAFLRVSSSFQIKLAVKGQESIMFDRTCFQQDCGYWSLHLKPMRSNLITTSDLFIPGFTASLTSLSTLSDEGVPHPERVRSTEIAAMPPRKDRRHSFVMPSLSRSFTVRFSSIE